MMRIGFGSETGRSLAPPRTTTDLQRAKAGSILGLVVNDFMVGDDGAVLTGRRGALLERRRVTFFDNGLGISKSGLSRADMLCTPRLGVDSTKGAGRRRRGVMRGLGSIVTLARGSGRRVGTANSSTTEKQLCST